MALSYDDSTVNIVVTIIIIIFSTLGTIWSRGIFTEKLLTNVKMGMSLRAVTGWKTVMQQNCIKALY